MYYVIGYFFIALVFAGILVGITDDEEEHEPVLFTFIAFLWPVSIPTMLGIWAGEQIKRRRKK